MAIVREAGFNLVNIDAGSVDVKAASYLKRAKTAQGIAKLASRKSIMTMAAPGLYMYPVIMSGGIETNKAMEIARAFQLTYASSVATAYSLHGDMDRADTPQLADFVQKFHQNDPKLINANLNAAANALGIESYHDEFLHDHDVSVESANYLTNSISDVDMYLLDLAAWESVEDGLVMESLNDIYRPYNRTRKILEDKLQTIKDTKEKIATEAGGVFDKAGQAFDNIGGAIDDMANGKNKSSHNATGISRNVNVPKNFNEVKRVDPKQMTNLEPTLVNVQVIAHGGKKSAGTRDASGSNAQSVHNLTLCIKAMPRIVNSSVMIASMIEACQGSHGIFKFLKWTKGEKKTLDKILGISTAKQKAIEKNAKQEVKFLEQSRKRKSKGLIGRFLRNEVLPTTTVVITNYEAEKIKEACGVDLNRYEMAAKLINKYYLLGFCIYDTEQETMKTLFDADSDWGLTSFQSMVNANNSAKDALNQNEVLRIFGRR